MQVNSNKLLILYDRLGTFSTDMYEWIRFIILQNFTSFHLFIKKKKNDLPLANNNARRKLEFEDANAEWSIVQ